MCQATIILGRPLALPVGFFSYFPSHQRPSFSEIHELTGEPIEPINVLCHVCSGVTILSACHRGFAIQSI